MYDGIKLRVGKVAIEGIRGTPIPPDGRDADNFVSVDPDHHLPRIGPMIDQGIVEAEDFPQELQDKQNSRSLPFVADASAVLDPASSHGVLHAIMSRMMAGHAIVQVVRHEFYETPAARSYSRWISDWFEYDERRLRDFHTISTRNRLIDEHG